MACNVILNTLLNDGGAPHDTGGYFVYLGYHASAQMPANGGDDDCFAIDVSADNDLVSVGDGILDGIAGDGNNPYGADAGNLGVTEGQTYPYGASIDFAGIPAGFYGFMYIVGDINADGAFTGDECGEIECFEIEVVDSPPEMLNASASYCEDSLPAAPLDLAALVDAVPGSTYTSGGVWAEPDGGPSDPDFEGQGGVLNASTGNLTTIPAMWNVGTYIFEYTLEPGDLSSTHDIDEACPECETQTVTVTIVITPLLEAGAGASAAVCN